MIYSCTKFSPSKTNQPIAKAPRKSCRWNRHSDYQLDPFIGDGKRGEMKKKLTIENNLSNENWSESSALVSGDIDPICIVKIL